MKFLITGANGQLAREFLMTLNTHDVIALSKEHLDISNPNAVSNAISQHKPDVVLNCAAYNSVDRAEDDFDSAFRTNAIGVRNLATACKMHNTLIVHYSTDYVFDGEKNDFYTEEDKPNPINKYGESKLLGEKYLTEETDNFLLFRVSWVFGKGKQNFLYKLSEWAKKNNVLTIVCDQISVPTYTVDIVKFTLLSIKEGLRGTYHLTNSGCASRYEVARYYLEKIGLTNLILPVNSEDFHEKANRPHFSVMSNVKLSKALKLSIPSWKEGIEKFIKRGMK
ncbi:NAD(P)-dependent oxidoreductase [Dissulfurispira thermophila]|uniref:dTDP-4-dehydrorhamnose reductase n=1 Tax=Dissulfurispira thermophila TaxID=2715679 RepID=A0A7G1H5A5_9BACT|nr:dTDP-4-dehydrorhamnose reductase [Dissulfurispira thermophila]BCB97301.1 NAD(P)-dependent oxidoreductase [Dissulfurispira thermophila]